MFMKLLTAAAIATLVAAPALAEQYVAQLDAPFDGASEMLLKNLKIVEIDSYTLNGAYYMVIAAPDEGYLEAYFYAVHRRPIALYALGADWTGPGLAALSLEQHLPFLSPIPCEFCES